MTAYKYRPLDLNESSIRLLKLLEGNLGDDIQCEIVDGLIEESIPYDALSYTWGSTEKTAMITADGFTMSVTLNAYEALQQIRSNDGSRYLWIDAICIDQDNIQERGHQVQQMSLIYQKAERVIVWLGQGTKETDRIMDSMKQLHHIFLRKEGDWRQLAQFWINLCPAGCYEGMELLLGRPWFRRIWILQEIANARVATIHCGSRSISASTFAQVPSLLGLQPDPHCQAVLDIMPGHSRQTSWWKHNRGLHTLLKKFGNSEATDKRDIVYALLGISSDASKKMLPDYEKPLLQVICDTISLLLYHIQLDGSFYKFLDWTLLEFLQSLDSLGSVVLRKASKDGQETIVRRLLAIGKTEVDLKDGKGRTSLSWAAEAGHEAIVKLLLEMGQVEVNSKGTWDGRTPLSWAAERGHEGIVKLLLKSGQADVDSKDRDGQTPMSWAAKRGHVAVVKLLLESDQVDVDSKDEGGRTPLSWAAEEGHEAVVKLLLEIGQVEVDSKGTWDGRTPLSWAVERGHVAVVKLLLKSGQVDVDSRDAWENRTSLSRAAEKGHEAIVKLLLGSSQVGIDLKDRDGQTPMSWAANRGHEGIVELLRKTVD